jgi:hypothetical protein
MCTFQSLPDCRAYIGNFVLKYFFVANAFISPFNTQTMPIKSFYYMYTTALLCFPKNLIPSRDSNPGLGNFVVKMQFEMLKSATTELCTLC